MIIHQQFTNQATFPFLIHLTNFKVSYKLQTILCFDYGHKKIGTAVGNDVLKTAQELTTVGCNNGTPDWSLIDKLITEWKPNLLLLGLPLNMDGTESKFCKQVREFGKRLGNRYNLNVEHEDERLSSNEADTLLRSSVSKNQGLSKKLQSKRDQIAARLILESYFARYA